MRAWPQRRQSVGLQSVVVRTLSGGTSRRCALRCPGCPPRFRPEGGVGGLRLNPMGSDEGGLEELVELSLSRASRSRTRCSSSRTRPLTESSMAVMAIWASGGTVFQSGSGIGGRGIIALILRAYYTKGSARERARHELGAAEAGHMTEDV